MCLTIPKKILSINRGSIIVEGFEGKKEKITASLVKIKKGDWVLTINKIAIKKIPASEAGEILELLQYQPKINPEKLDKKFREIIEATHFRKLTKKEVVFLLNTQNQEYKAMLQEANTIRLTNLRDSICIHGVIEFSNFCKKDCCYCGLRSENHSLPRYRMSVEEIIETAVKAVDEKGYKLLVLQSGEDDYYTDEILENIIKRIKERCRVFIFISIGERNKKCYQRLKKAGASGVLFRFETSNEKLFKKIHPKGKNLKKRLEHLRFFKKMGYFIATGSMIGLPGQTVNDLYSDIKLIQKWSNMVSMGPFIPASETPLENTPVDEKTNKWKIEMNLKMIAILRLLMKSTRIPVVTALETISGEEGRKAALLAGANALMLNLTPSKYRSLYKIYNDKFYKEYEKWEHYGLFKFEESYQMLEERIQKELRQT